MTHTLTTESDVTRAENFARLLRWAPIIAGGVIFAFSLIFIHALLSEVTFADINQSFWSASFRSLALCVLFGRTAWKVARWNADRFAVTTARAMLVTGLLNRQVSMVPLRKLTDMSLRRSPLGMLLDYGEFVIESAGESQAMHSIRFLPRPDVLYVQLSELLFAADGALTASEW